MRLNSQDHQKLTAALNKVASVDVQHTTPIIQASDYTRSSFDKRFILEFYLVQEHIPFMSDEMEGDVVVDDVLNVQPLCEAHGDQPAPHAPEGNMRLTKVVQGPERNVLMVAHPSSMPDGEERMAAQMSMGHSTNLYCDMIRSRRMRLS